MSELKIRKLTPKECFRLMGFEDADFEKAEAVNSNTQLYKQAGNSIVVPVVEYIIKALLDCGALENQREEKEMELKMNQYQLPEKIGFNYEEIKTELQAKVSMYETLVYTDDAIKDAKADKAKLNKLKKALNDERIRLQKEYMQPFEEFKEKIDELIRIIDNPVSIIDKQIKGYENQKKAEKLEQVKEYFETLEKPEWLSFEQIVHEKWGNSTTTMRWIQDSMEGKLNGIKRDMATLQNLPEFSFEAVEVYKQTLDINKAISEGKRLAEIQKRKAEHDEKMKKLWDEKAEQERQAKAEAAQHMIPPAEEKPTEPLKMWVSFKALMTTEDAFALKDFFSSRGIEFRSI